MQWCRTGDTSPVAYANRDVFEARGDGAEPLSEVLPIAPGDIPEPVAPPVVGEVDALTVHALSVVAEVDELTFHAPYGAEVDALTFHAPPVVAAEKLTVDDVPRPLTRAPAAPDPATRPPHPPPRRPRIAPFGVALQPRRQRIAFADQPRMTRM